MNQLDGYFAVMPDDWQARTPARRAERIEATKRDPLLFAVTYLNAHLLLAGRITFGQMHLSWYDEIAEWTNRTAFHKPRSWRRAYVSPRDSAKTTVWFLFAPLWAAAHGWAKFVAAFADSGLQAEMHLSTFKRELDTNELLRYDYSDLCAPATGDRSKLVSDNRHMTIRKNGFVFGAKGADASSLGMKVGENRPDVIILDDIEPDASNYSPYLCEKRLATLQNSILPLNLSARVIWSGTVTMEGSLIHQLVKTVTTNDDPAPWTVEEGFEVRYFPAIWVDDDGIERSIWPDKWAIEDLQAMRHTRSFALNFMNKPIGDGGFWSPDDIRIELAPAYPRTIITVDPAVTKKNRSDFTGIAVMSHNKITGKVTVREVWKVKLSPKELKAKVFSIMLAYLEATVLLVETNQGGDTWADVFGELPIKYREKKQTIKKEDRALVLLNGYQKREVVHAEPLPLLDSELLAFPVGLNDDLVDAVGTGYSYFTGAGLDEKERPRPIPAAKTLSYI
jgi:phage terminase large subunit-like protein